MIGFSQHQRFSLDCFCLDRENGSGLPHGVAIKMSSEFDGLASKSIARQILSFSAYHICLNALFLVLVPFGEHIVFSIYTNISGNCSLFVPNENCSSRDPLVPFARFFLLNLASSIALTFVYAFAILGCKTVLNLRYCVILSILTISVFCCILESSPTFAAFDIEELDAASIIHIMLTAIVLGTVHGSFSHFMMKQEFLARYGNRTRYKQPA